MVRDLKKLYKKAKAIHLSGGRSETTTQKKDREFDEIAKKALPSKEYNQMIRMKKKKD